MTKNLNKYSSRVTQPKSQGASQAMLYGTGLSEADMDKPQVGIAAVWYEGNTCNMHLNDLAARVKEGVTAAGMVGHAVQHHRRQRRDLDGHRGHELLAAIPRPDRRLDRDRDGRAVVRRADRPARLRQEHARLPDRDGPAQPAGDHGLRRHDSGRGLGGPEARYRLRVPVLWRVPGRQDRRGHTAGDRQHSCPGAGACGGMYTANTMATAIEALGMSLALQRLDPGGRSRQAGRVPAGGPGDSAAARTGSQAAGHHDAPGVRKRDGDGHGPGRLDQRGPAPDCHGPGRGRAADASTTSRRSATACRTWPT